MREKDIPMWLSHKPIVSVDYETQDACAGDAKFLSIGKSTWNENDISAKIWRKSHDQWSRQSEEIPLWRVLDLAKLVIATITGKSSSLNEQIVSPEDAELLNSFINENMELFSPRLKELQELLAPANNDSASSSSEPNLFSFATSELSQDAILAWLISWADDSNKTKDEPMCMLGKSFLSLLTNIPAEKIHTTAVRRQWKNIDITVEINEDTVLIIEDKTETCIHHKQDIRYKETIHKEYKDKRKTLLYTYVKTGNESLSKIKRIEKHGYRTINRQDILSMLNQYNVNNIIVTSFRSHLQQIEAMTHSYRRKYVKDWHRYEWQGFYQELEQYLDNAEWDYVANRSGGFWGLWWHFKSNDKVSMYLQFEERKLCIKIKDKSNNNQTKIRQKYYEILMREAKKAEVSIKKPERFGAGMYMTIGIIEENIIFGNELINIENIIKKLRMYEQVLNNCF